ncbi:NADPH-dependent FMN reductase [Streptomyces sp. NPDC059740]|uniref:NADPH-dependent FMN reductase n=1 Tax=Streptomyces sp. NPDC059740 TaxID=3346926 RepID=UPI0036546D0F
MTKIVLLPGSVRGASVNRTVLATLEDRFSRRPGKIGTGFLDPGALPHFDQDVEQDETALPAAVSDARALVTAADALVISTPSYNGAMSGVLKNALDWLSRPWRDSSLTGRPTAILSASPGRRGGEEAQAGLRAVLERAGAVLLDHPVLAVSNATQRETARGLFTEPALVAALDAVAESVLTGLGLPAHPDPQAATGV